MTIELTEEECEELTRLVETALRNIGPEIHHTATRDFKDYLKAEKRVLQSLFERLSVLRAA